MGRGASHSNHGVSPLLKSNSKRFVEKADDDNIMAAMSVVISVIVGVANQPKAWQIPLACGLR